MDENTQTTQYDKLSKRIRYNVEIHKSEENYKDIIDSLLEDSKFIALSIIYPYEDYSELELPKKYYNWQIRACIELYKLAGKKNVSSYSENGLSWTMFKDGLSNDLLNEIMPKVGVPKVVEENV